MEFFCEVHISIKLTKYIQSLGHGAIHVNSLPAKWYTSDSEICQFADRQQLIVIRKDEYFRNAFFLRNSPKKLVRFILGNVSNQMLIDLFSKNLSLISDLSNEKCFYLELGEKVTVYTPDI
jgi:predicted nuclease of predicted toxin-antitoxin system